MDAQGLNSEACAAACVCMGIYECGYDHSGLALKSYAMCSIQATELCTTCSYCWRSFDRRLRTFSGNQTPKMAEISRNGQGEEC